MLDILKIKEDPQAVASALLKKGAKVDFAELLSWDEQLRGVIQEVETLRAQRNQVSAQVPQLKKAGQDVSELLAEMKRVGDRIATLDQDRGKLEEQIHQFLIALPNIPDADVVAGGKEANQVIRTFGHQPEFKFAPKSHVELCESLGLIDYERGVKLGGNGFWVYTGPGALLEWSLLNYFIDFHRRAGFTFILPPHILNWESGYVAGQFPKFSEDVFLLKSDEGKSEQDGTRFLLPTAETALANLYRGEILKDESLPKKLFGYTPCFRREGGGYGASERGMVRGHQFNKVELFVYCKPEQSDTLLEDLIKAGEGLMQGLGLHYQVSKLAAADCSASMAKTYDIEVWIPSMSIYKEVSSASNARDYQARRGGIRYKDSNGKNQLVHTLNASGLATSRLFPAIIEQFQQVDGSVIVPQVLRQWVGAERLSPLR